VSGDWLNGELETATADSVQRIGEQVKSGGDKEHCGYKKIWHKERRRQ